jgi:hypothetical protein
MVALFYFYFYNKNPLIFLLYNDLTPYYMVIQIIEYLYYMMI